MRKNEYKSFEEFYEEYRYDRDVLKGHYTGLEFKYNGKHYRFSHDYANNDTENEYKYFAYEIIRNNSKDEVQQLIAKYHDIDEALEKWHINNVSFKEIIMLDETIILSKD